MVKNNAARRLKRGALLVTTLLVLSACDRPADTATADCDDGSRDWEMVTFGVTLPSPVAFDLSRLPAGLIAEHLQGPALMVAQINRGNGEAVKAYWQGLGALTDPNEQMRGANAAIEALYGRGLMVLHQAQAWQAREPNSEVAQLMLAAAYAHAGYEVAQQKWDRHTTRARYNRLEGRMKAANQWLQPLLSRQDVVGRSANMLNLSVTSYLDGPAYEAAWKQYLKVIEFAPKAEKLYLDAVWYVYSDAADGGAERAQRLVALATANGLPANDAINVKQAVAALDSPPEKNPNPAAIRPYWEARVNEAPTENNLTGWLKAEQDVQNWAAMLDLSDRIIAINPHQRYAWQQRTWALAQTGRFKEAYEAAIVASTLGGDWAMNRIIQGYVRGEMGLPARDFDAAIAHCRFGAVLALPSGANCLGSLYTDGVAGIARDPASALAWHFLAARGGHSNSQHDVAVLLPQVVNQPESAKDIDFAAGHWLRRAAVQDHQPAINKLEGRPHWGEVCRPKAKTDWILPIYQVLRLIFI